MTIAILDPFSGIAGDMTLGALVACGLDVEWLRALPSTLGLEGVTVRIQDVQRGQIACKKVDFDIPAQPHGRHVAQIRAVIARSGAPPAVRERADQAVLAIAAVEGELHGVAPERVHLHEVGAVDAILDILGSIWGFALLGVSQVYSGPLALGDGTVDAAHGTLPVPAPATLKLLEGHAVTLGPEGSGELVTPTGAALVRVLSAGPPPRMFTPRRSGFGAGTKDFRGRANALRLVLADDVDVASAPGDADSAIVPETLVVLAADIDDLAGEYIAAAAERLRVAGALDVVLLPTTMKKGRPGARIEILARRRDADRLEGMLLAATTTVGVRRWSVERRALPRRERTVLVLGHRVSVKEVSLPDGAVRAKPEYDAVVQVAEATGRPVGDIFSLAAEAARTQQYVPESAPVGAMGAPDGGHAPEHVPHPVRSRSQV